MIWTIAGGLVILVMAGFIWGVLHLRQSQRVASEAIARVSLSDLAKLCVECQTVFADSFNEQLSLDELENSARILSARLDSAESVKKAFAKPEFYWYFVLPVGAFLGQLICRHANGVWAEAEGGGLEVQIPVAGEPAVTYPFDKVIKQVTMGDKGDIYAYLMTAVKLEEAIGDAEDGDPNTPE